MKKIKILGFGFVFAFLMLSPTESNARCTESNYVSNGHLYIERNCYFLGIRYSHTITDMGEYTGNGE